MSLTLHPAPEPTVIVAGLAFSCADGGNSIAIRTLRDGGWATSIDLSPSRPDPSVNQITTTPDGRLILYGSENDLAPDGGVRMNWKVWSKTVGSSSPFQLIDSPSSVGHSGCVGAAIDSEGRLTTVGQRDGELTLRREDQGSWSNLYVETPPAGCSIQPRVGLGIDRAGNLAITGLRDGFGCGSARTDWFTAVGTDGGTRWDSSRTDQPAGAQAVDVSAAPDGTVYSTGFTTGGSVSAWVVRRGTNVGTSWSEVDRFQPVGTAGCIPQGSTATDEGAWVVGRCYEADGGWPVWMVRGLHDGGWSTDDTWVHAPRPNQGSIAVAVRVDAQGSVYVVGYSYDDAGLPIWVTRKSECL